MTNPLRNLCLPPRVARWLPGTSRSFGPPRGWAAVRDYAAKHGIPNWAVEGPETVPSPHPAAFGAIDPYYVSQGDKIIPEKLVFSLEHGCIYGPNGNIVAADDTFLWDTSWHGGDDPEEAASRDRALFRRKKSRPRRRLPGRTAAVTSDWAVGSFAHFLTDALPRWRLLAAAGYGPRDFDQVAVFHPNSPTTRLLIERAGLPREHIVGHDPAFDYECESLLATTFPGSFPAISPASIAWLRGLAGGGEPRRRVYITRAGYKRHPANATEIEAELARRGFSTAHGDDGTAVLEACAGARAVIGVEGSNLFNLCFAPPGARTVMLLPGPRTIPYISYICQAAGQEIAIVSAAPGSTPDAPVFPIGAVRAALDWSEAAP